MKDTTLKIATCLATMLFLALLATSCSSKSGTDDTRAGTDVAAGDQAAVDDSVPPAGDSSAPDPETTGAGDDVVMVDMHIQADLHVQDGMVPDVPVEDLPVSDFHVPEDVVLDLCTEDCPGRPPGNCGNGTCEPGEEDFCFQDCGGGPPEDCGNGVCDAGEEEFCFEDCGGEPPGGPIKCEDQADCDAPGGCEEEATMGCICVPDPGGQKRCIPACNTDADCPKIPDMELVCSPEGACFPEMGPPPN